MIYSYEDLLWDTVISRKHLERKEVCLASGWTSTMCVSSQKLICVWPTNICSLPWLSCLCLWARCSSFFFFCLLLKYCSFIPALPCEDLINYFIMALMVCVQYPSPYDRLALHFRYGVYYLTIKYFIQSSFSTGQYRVTWPIISSCYMWSICPDIVGWWISCLYTRCLTETQAPPVSGFKVLIKTLLSE